MDVSTVNVIFQDRVKTRPVPLDHKELTEKLKNAKENIIWCGGELHRPAYYEDTPGNIPEVLRELCSKEKSILFYCVFGPNIYHPETNATLQTVGNLVGEKKIKFYRPEFRIPFHFWLIDNTLFYADHHSPIHFEDEPEDTSYDHFVLEGEDVRDYVVEHFFDDMVNDPEYPVVTLVNPNEWNAQILFKPLSEVLETV